MTAAAEPPKSIGAFLRAEPERFREWMLRRQGNLVAFCVVAIVAGAGSYGAVMGCWRDPLQALYTGIKLPLVILLTTLGNGLLNGMLAPLLGLNVTFRQSLAVVLMSFAVAAMVLGALSPVALFIVWNTPPLAARNNIVVAGIRAAATDAGGVCCAGRRDGQSSGSCRCCGHGPAARPWRATSCSRGWREIFFSAARFAGCCDPFIWEANRPVEFIGQHCFQGSFFETIFKAVCRLIFS